MNALSVASAGSPVGLLDELLAKGAISAREHAEQSAQYARDLVLQSTAQRQREAKFPGSSLPPNRNHQEPDMNPKDLLDTMELNRKVMTEQMKTLNAMSHSAPGFAVKPGDAAHNAADLLNTLTNGHLQSAALSLQALSGATARVRGQWAQAQVDNCPPPASHAETIDVQVVEIHPAVEG